MNESEPEKVFRQVFRLQRPSTNYLFVIGQTPSRNKALDLANTARMLPGVDSNEVSVLSSAGATQFYITVGGFETAPKAAETRDELQRTLREMWKVSGVRTNAALPFLMRGKVVDAEKLFGE